MDVIKDGYVPSAHARSLTAPFNIWADHDADVASAQI
jgi:hypothetical protein